MLLPACTPELAGFEVGEDVTPEGEAALRGYFTTFADPRLDPETGPHCVCGEPLIGLLFGAFKWGLAWGEGYCTKCKHPARAHHRITTPDGSKVAEIYGIPLPYHPALLQHSKD